MGGPAQRSGAIFDVFVMRFSKNKHFHIHLEY